MYAGIDFGTTNCAMGTCLDGRPQLVPLEGNSPFLPTAVYSPLEEIGPIEIDEAVLSQRVKAELKAEITRELEKSSLVEEEKKLKAAEHKLKFIYSKERDAAERSYERQKKKVERLRGYENDRHLEEKRQRNKMELEMLNQLTARRQQETLDDTLNRDEGILFGTAALQMHYRHPNKGLLAKSPKLFLGELELREAGIDRFTKIVGLLLSHIKETAEKRAGKCFDNVVLGRPVNFCSSGNEDANNQAEGILRSAANTAGFKEVSFLLEPLAAALDFETTLTSDVVALIVDSGGGTTDCSIVTLGPSYSSAYSMEERVLASSGTRAGGVDFDVLIGRQLVMPHFGEGTRLRDGRAIPNRFFSHAVAVDEMKTLEQFFEMNLNGQLANPVCPEKVNRLKVLHAHRQSRQLVASCEKAKIALSEEEHSVIQLEFIEKAFGIAMNREDLESVTRHAVERIMKTVREVTEISERQPELVYLTGGTSKSRHVVRCIKSRFPGLKCVFGDSFGSVASGLALHAHRIYA